MKHERRHHVADYRTRDGRTGWVEFYSSAQTWRGLCRTARTQIYQQSFFKLGQMVMPEEIAFLIVDGNAA